MRTNRRIAALAVLGVISCGLALADTFYVNGGCGNDAWSGRSQVCEEPNGPKATIQAGIDAAADGDEVRIADGVYRGFRNRGLNYAGKSITVRSSGGAANCIIDCEQEAPAFLFVTAETETARLIGITIRRGRALNDNECGPCGGAIYLNGASPTIENCVIDASFAENSGGGIYARDSRFILVNCTVSNNVSSIGQGGGLSLYRSSPKILDCYISGNASGSFGGGVYCNGGKPEIQDCIITGNIARRGGGGGITAWRNDMNIRRCIVSDNRTGGHGGGIYADNFGGTISNCLVLRNHAQSHGGGVFCSGGSAVIQTCTIAGNSAGEGGGGLARVGLFQTELANSILWGDAANFGDEIALVNFGDHGSLRVAYNTIEGGKAGIHVGSGEKLIWAFGNRKADPRFVDPASDDYRLTSDSPCVDRGDPDYVVKWGDTDIAGRKRIWNGLVDMGANEFGSFPFGDLNCDGSIDLVDIYPFLTALDSLEEYRKRFPTCDPILADLNFNGVVDPGDIEPFVELLVGSSGPGSN